MRADMTRAHGPVDMEPNYCVRPLGVGAWRETATEKGFQEACYMSENCPMQRIRNYDMVAR